MVLKADMKGKLSDRLYVNYNHNNICNEFYYIFFISMLQRRERKLLTQFILFKYWRDKILKSFIIRPEYRNKKTSTYSFTPKKNCIWKDVDHVDIPKHDKGAIV